MYNELTLQQMASLPGIGDLKTAAKVKFIKALMAEEAGDHEAAARFLDEAIKAGSLAVPAERR